MTGARVHLDLPEQWQPMAVAPDGVAFAAMLLAPLQVAVEGTDGHQALAASLTVSFRLLPGATDPAVVAQGTLQSLRDQGRVTRRAELVGLGRDPGRPGVLVREQRASDEGPIVVTQVLWLVPGTSQLACVAVASPARALATELTELALAAAAGLRVDSGEVRLRA